MISLREFLRTFRGTGFPEKDLTVFYRSVRKSVILRSMGKSSLSELFRLEEQCQWPILNRIDDPDLPIYRGADSALLSAFIGNIRKEKDLRAQKRSMEKLRYWTALRFVIEERTELFREIFGFCRKDTRRCEMVAERYRKMLDRRIMNRRRLWQIGVGAGAATLAGTATLWYLTRKK
ncbi:MAG: hypothetical protein WC291_04810 [Thermodesulfovibrionales bacterium]|jgi:hypothetical protein